MVGLRALLVMFATLTVILPAAARQVALVIGNDAYQHIPPLQKAVADAAAYAKLLQAKGYDVTLKKDLTRDQMDDAVAAFTDALATGDTAVFIYSGHGWSDGAQNYLLGIDVPARGSKDSLARRSIPLKNGLDGILDSMDQKAASLKIAIIDACRDNPFQSSISQKGVGLAKGLAPIIPPNGTFVVFSAAAGQSALDRLSDTDDNPNSVFTRVFLPLIDKDMTLLDAIKLTQKDVVAIARSADQDQRPSYYDEVTGPVCLVSTCSGSVPAAGEGGAVVSIPDRKPVNQCETLMSIIDKTICSNSDLKNIDQQLKELVAELYKNLSKPKKRALYADHKQWKLNRNAQCLSSSALADCLIDSTKKRIDKLKSYADNSPPHQDEPLDLSAPSHQPPVQDLAPTPLPPTPERRASSGLRAIRIVSANAHVVDPFNQLGAEYTIENGSDTDIGMGVVMDSTTLNGCVISRLSGLGYFREWDIPGMRADPLNKLISVPAGGQVSASAMFDGCPTSRGTVGNLAMTLIISVGNDIKTISSQC